MSVELPPWKQEGTEITKADGDSLDRLIEFNDKHNRKKDLHRKILYLFIGYATYVLLKYLFDVSANFVFLQKFFERNLFLDLFIGAVLYFTSKFVYDLKEKAKDEYHSLRNEIVDLCNKEWIKKYSTQTNQQIYDYVYHVHDIRINHKTK